MHVHRPGWGVAVRGSCSVVGLREWAGVSYACVPSVVPCLFLIAYACQTRLLVTHSVSMLARLCMPCSLFNSLDDLSRDTVDSVKVRLVSLYHAEIFVDMRPPYALRFMLTIRGTREADAATP